MRAAKGEGSVVKAAGGYRGYVTVNGKRAYTKVYPTKALAAAAKRELLTRRDDGRLTAGKSPTVAQWMNHWLENVAKHRPTTYAMNKWVTETKIIPELGSIKINALTPERIEQWVTDLHVAPSSARRYLAPLKTALNVAAKRGGIGFNPADRVELAASAKPNTTAYSREDRDAILAAAQGRNRVRWHLGLKIGLRPSEVLGLTWPDFNERAGTLAIAHQMLRATGKGLYLQDAPKTDAGVRTIRLPKSLVKMLHEHRREQLAEIAVLGDERTVWEQDGKPVALMFTQENGRPIDARMDTRLWKKLLEQSGVETARRYQARHTAATHMIVDSGGDIAVTAKVLGHADSAFTYRTYVHPLEEREAALMEQLDAPAAPYRAPYGSDVERSQAETNTTQA